MAERESVVHYTTYDEDDDLGSDDADTPYNGYQHTMPENDPQISMKRTQAKSGSLALIIATSLVAMSLVGLVIVRMNFRNTIYNTVAEKQEELSRCEAENVRLQSELESRASAKNVEDYAENELGMQKIDSSQIRYIKIQTDDVVNIPEQDKGILSRVESFFDRCVEYFRG